jgi:hypothetical protein
MSLLRRGTRASRASVGYGVCSLVTGAGAREPAGPIQADTVPSE